MPLGLCVCEFQAQLGLAQSRVSSMHGYSAMQA